jgi:hypothetical protein
VPPRAVGGRVPPVMSFQGHIVSGSLWPGSLLGLESKDAETEGSKRPNFLVAEFMHQTGLVLWETAFEKYQSCLTHKLRRTPSARQTRKHSTAKYQKMNKELLP